MRDICCLLFYVHGLVIVTINAQKQTEVLLRSLPVAKESESVERKKKTIDTKFTL